MKKLNINPVINIRVTTIIALVVMTALLTTTFIEYGGKSIITNLVHNDLEQSEIDIYNRPLPDKINQYITTKYSQLLKEYGVRKIYVNEPAAINVHGYTRVYDDKKQYSYQNQLYHTAVLCCLQRTTRRLNYITNIRKTIYHTIRQRKQSVV